MEDASGSPEPIMGIAGTVISDIKMDV